MRPRPLSSPSTNTEQGSVGGLRAVLWFQAIITVVAAKWAYDITLGLGTMVGYTTAQVHSHTSGFIWLVVLC